MSNCNIGDALVAQIAPVLGKCELWELDLSQNALTSTGVQTLATHVLPYLGLKHLSLAGNNIKLQGLELIGSAFGESKYKGIHTIDLSDCNIAVAKSSLSGDSHFAAEVKILDLSGNHFGNTGRLWQFLLGKNTTLAELDLSRTGLKDKGFTKLLPPALAIPTLTTLLLSENLIHDEPLQLLQQMLQDPGCHLKKLDLTGNAFGDDGVQRIAQGLLLNTSLVELSLSRLLISAVGINAIDIAITNNPVKTLKRVYLILVSGTAPRALNNPNVIVTTPLPSIPLNIVR